MRARREWLLAACVLLLLGGGIAQDIDSTGSSEAPDAEPASPAEPGSPAETGLPASPAAGASGPPVELAVDRTSRTAPPDLLALLTLRSSITRDPKGILTSWQATDPCAEPRWTGVGCEAPQPGGSSMMRVSSISLSGHGLQGTLPAFDTSGGALETIHTLDLSNNNFTGSIPASWGGLRSLANLFVQLNGITGTLPDEIGDATRIRFLGLDGGFTAAQNWPIGCFDPCTVRSANDPSQNLPPGCTVPCHLGNELEGQIPSSLGRLTNLIQIDAHRNRLGGTLPPSLSNWASADWIELSGNYISGTIPSEYGRMKRLTKLFLDNNQHSGSIPESFSLLPNLAVFNAKVNQLTGPLPPMPASVTTMDLSTNKLEGELSVGPGGNIPLGIGVLLLDRNNFTGPIIGLGSCQHLTVFSIEHNEGICGAPPFPLTGEMLTLYQQDPAYHHELGHRCNAIRLQRQKKTHCSLWPAIENTRIGQACPQAP